MSTDRPLICRFPAPRRAPAMPSSSSETSHPRQPIATRAARDPLAQLRRIIAAKKFFRTHGATSPGNAGSGTQSAGISRDLFPLRRYLPINGKEVTSC